MRKLSKKIIINSGIYENRVAVLEKGRLEEFYVEQGDSEQIFGNIYKGIVESVVHGIGAAFINIGTEKNGFLYVSDVQNHVPVVFDEGDDIVIERPAKNLNADIGSMLKVGQEIIVQVVKESIGTKGPRLTSHLSIPGRHLVLTPFDASLGISKKITEGSERIRIREAFKSIKLPPGIGCIVRTAAEGAPVSSLKREMKYLLNLWRRIWYRSQKVRPPDLIYEEYGLILRTIRDHLTEDVHEVIVDSKEEYKKMVRFLNQFMPEMKSRFINYTGSIPVFEKCGIEKEIEKVFRRKIRLKSGGSIVIEQTEGMVAIDVNTERYTGRKNIEDTVYRTNLEAASEIARQIRLRDIGGIIIIDFIDMRGRDHRNKVQDVFERAIRRDRAKTKILSISAIGILEMTRQRMRKSLESSMYKSCPVCHGRGLVKSETTIAMQVMRKVERESYLKHTRKLDVWVHSTIFEYLMAHEKKFLLPLRRRCRKDVLFHKDDNLKIEDVKIG